MGGMLVRGKAKDNSICRKEFGHRLAAVKEPAKPDKNADRKVTIRLGLLNRCPNLESARKPVRPEEYRRRISVPKKATD